MNATLPTLLLALATAATAAPYREEVSRMGKHTRIIELKRDHAAVAIAPAYQARVMTSTASGDDGYSFGWLNHPLIERGIQAGSTDPAALESHIHVFGGEERFWLGPEGGQFGIFFPKDAPFDFTNWKTPPALDTEPFDLVASSATRADFFKAFHVTNHSGTRFDVAVKRSIRLLTHAELESALGAPPHPDLKVVAYETINHLTNRGNNEWTENSGMLSIWLLGMYQPSPTTVVAIPVREGNPDELGPAVNDNYFGKIPPDRLKVANHVVYLKGDGAQRGKIGIPPRRSLGVAGSYSGEQNALTLVLCDPQEKETRYVNSAWEKQEKPFAGDAINAYNDGSPEPGKPPLGPFYELETSSPAAALKPGATLTHRQTTIHVVGPEAQLDTIATRKLHTSIRQIREAFTPAAE